MNRKRLTLIILLLLLLLALLYAFWGTPRQGRVTDSAAKEKISVSNEPRKVSERRGKSQETLLPRLKTELLDRKPEPYGGVHRDLFYSFRGDLPEVVEPIVPIVDEPPPPPPVVEPPPMVAPPPTLQQIAARELARFTFLGFLKKGTEKTIFLSSEGEIFLVHQGDRFGRKNEFLVTGVTPNELVIRQEEVGEIKISLVDQEPLKPSFSEPPEEVSAPDSEAQAVPPPAANWRAARRNRVMPAPVVNQPNEVTDETEE